jgi:hypothetical protein
MNASVDNDYDPIKVITWMKLGDRSGLRSGNHVKKRSGAGTRTG